MSCTLFLFLTLADDYAYFSFFYCIFVPYLQRNKIVDNVQQKHSFYVII